MENENNKTWSHCDVNFFLVKILNMNVVWRVTEIPLCYYIDN